METTRHFTATVYLVHDDDVLLHEHDRLDMWLPPGGHIDRDELPHEAAIRETEEETGLSFDLLQEAPGPRSDSVRPIPQPATILLEDINVHGDEVGHQHIDFIYYGETQERTIRPDPGETPANRWEWVDRNELQSQDRFTADVVALGLDAIDAVGDPTNTN